jgi:hypothetical protein
VFLWAFDVNIVEFKLDVGCIVDLGMAGSCSLACEYDPVGRSIRISTHEIMLFSEVEMVRQEAWRNFREWLLEGHQRLHTA